MCKKMNLARVLNNIDKNKKLSLDVLFSAKIHKVDRVIISESDTQQIYIAVFPLEELNLLDVKDPFLVRTGAGFRTWELIF